MKKFNKKFSLLMLLCLVLMMLLPFQSKANEEVKTIIFEPDYVYDSAIYVDANTQEKIAPEMEGYLFGGWYVNDGTEYQVVASPVDGETYYAKFVPCEVLEVKAQVSSTLTDDDLENDETAALRLVTTIDSIYYKEVGFSFKIKNGNRLMNIGTLKSNQVYRQLYGVGSGNEVMDYVPEEEFCAASQYFKAITVKNIPQKYYDAEVIATPFWITVDGTKVEGTQVIKSTNLGRSWVYVNSSANAKDNVECGTYSHPFTSLEEAMNAVVEDEGKIIIQKECEISVGSDFAWQQHGKKFIITGEGNKTESLDFSSVSTNGSITVNNTTTEGTVLYIGDDVSFTNLNLTLTDIVYAGGNKLVVAEDTAVSNEVEYLFGGSQGVSADEKTTVANTDVTLLSGTYKHVYGGGYNCAVSGSTKVHVGGNANTDEKIDFRNHSKTYTLYGGSYGGVISKNTSVYVGENVRFNYIYGGGYQSGSSVSGVTNVTFKGKAMSIFGGSDKTVVGKGTNVIVNGTNAEVEQVFGGCESAKMTGTANVQILNGTVYRRVYGGCYNNYASLKWQSSHCVTGYATVTFGPSTNVTLKTDYDNDSFGIDDSTYYATSRYESNLDGEIGIMVVNDYDSAENANKGIVGTSDYLSSVQPYQFLVNASEGGEVYADGTNIHVKPDEGKVATVRENANDGAVSAYFEGEGDFALSETNEIYVMFTEERPDDVDLSKYEAEVGGNYFEALEDALMKAKELAKTEAVVITLLNDVEVDSVLSIGASYNITVQSDGENKYTIKANHTDDNVFTVYGTLTLENVSVEGGKQGIYVGNTGKVYSTKGLSITNTVLKGLYVDGGSVDAYGLSVSNTGEQAVQFQNKAKAIISNFDIEGTSSKVAVRIMTGADVTLNDGVIYANKTYGIYMDGASLVTATDTKVIRGENNTTDPLVGIASATSLFVFNQSENGEAYIDGQSYGGRGVDVKGTFVMNGGAIRNNKAESGAGVNVQEGATFTMTGGVISGNTATSTTTGGGGVYVAANSTFNMNIPETEGAIAGVIKENVASKFGAGVLVYGAFNMNAGTISNHGNANAYSSAEGAGVCLIGTSATMVMNGGEISNNYASSAGVGVSMRGGNTSYPAFTMNGGSITENHAKNNVGGIVLRYGTFTMNEGATISNNTASGVGGGVSMDGTARFILNGGTFSGNIAGKVNNDLNLTNTTAYIRLAKELTSDIHVSHGKAYASTTKIVEKQGDITSEHFKNSMKYIKVKENAEGQWFVNEQGLLTKGPVVLQSTGMGYSSLNDAMEVAAEEDTITILRNEEISSTLVIGKNLTIIGDKTVTISANASMGADMIKVEAEKTLAITGVNLVGNTKVPNVIHTLGSTQLTDVNITSGKMGIYISSGSVVANNILIQNSNDKGVSVQPGASFTATGIVVKNTTNQGLYFSGKSGQVATAIISDFEVTGTGKASIRPMSYCNVTLTNGTVTVTKAEAIATNTNNTLEISGVNVFTTQSRIDEKKVLYVNGGYVANDYFGDKVIVSVKE